MAESQIPQHPQLPTQNSSTNTIPDPNVLQWRPSQGTINNAAMVVQRTKREYLTRSVGDMRFTNVPEDQRQEYSTVFDNLWRLVIQVDPKMTMYAVLLSEDLVRRLIAIVLACQQQRTFLSADPPKYLLELPALKMMTGQLQEYIILFDRAWAAMVDKNSPFPATHRVVRWYPPSYDVRVEDAPFPKIEHPDDVIVKIALAGLCGSDLHIYRGHDVVTEVHTSGHEFVGQVIALGSNFLSVSGEQATSTGRPTLYSTLKVGDKVVSPFTVSCGECRPCRQGFSSRCARSLLFGSPTLEGGQAQYVRVPYAGGTLFRLADIDPHPTTGSRLTALADSSLILLADILPTGYFAALQLLQHPKLAPLLSGSPYPRPALEPGLAGNPINVPTDPLNIATIGLGPVGTCAVVSLLDLLWKNGVSYYRIVSIDPNEQRRELIKGIYAKLIEARPTIHPNSTFEAVDIETAKKASFSADKVGFDGVIEAAGGTSVLSLAFGLVRPFGVITSIGVHQDHPLPMSDRALYGKNVSLDFGRCPVRSIFPLVLDMLARHQDVFGEVGTKISLVDKIVGLEEAKVYYELFDKRKCGKVLFDPWK